MSGYTFLAEGVPTTANTNMNVSSGDMSNHWSEESLKNWPDLCKEGRKGTILIGLASGNKAIFPEGKKTGYFFGEALLPFEEFTKQGYKCLFISPDGTASPDETSIQGSNAEKHSVKVWNDKSHPIHRALLKIYRPEDFNDSSIAVLNGFYAAGGHQCLWSFPRATSLQNLVAKIYEKGGIVGFDCHGPALLDNLILSNGSKLIAGKKATGFSTSAEEKMVPGLLKQLEQEGIHTIEQSVKLNGGEWSESSNPMGEYVITDGRLVTGMNPASAKKLALEMLEMLNASMRLGGTTNFDKITGKNEGEMNKQNMNMNMSQGNRINLDSNPNLNNLEMNKTSTTNQMSGLNTKNELPAEFHRNSQPYEIDHPTKNI